MKNITEDDLILLYYGEHEDPDLAKKVAESAELSARFDQLGAELKLADSFAAPHRSDAYGSEVWQRISPQLESEAGKTGETDKSGKVNRTSESEEKRGWLKAWFNALSRPNVSLAGAISIALVVALAFMLGRNGGFEPKVDPLANQSSTISDPALSTPNPDLATSTEAIAAANIDSSQLLAHSVSGHLEQVNLMLTQFANSPASLAHESAHATDVLVANRLYRQAAINQGNRQLAALLTELEPLLIEMAYEAQKNSPATRERMQEEVKNGLLFKVRVMNNQLRKPQTSV